MAHPNLSASCLFVAASLGSVAPAAAAPAADRMPPYRGLAVDRIPAGKIQHAVLEITHRTTRDGAPPPDHERELNFTERVESWNSRRGGRIVIALVAGRFVSDDAGRSVELGEPIEEAAVDGDTCRRWAPHTNVITRWRCTGVNDRGTAVLEHSETGLAHHFRNRSASFYDIDSIRVRGRRILRFRSVHERPSGSGDGKTVGDVPPDAPARPTDIHSERIARMDRSSLRLISDVNRLRFKREGHVYVRVSTLRVTSRRLLADTSANRRLLRMDHPGATVKQGRATHERPA